MKPGAKPLHHIILLLAILASVFSVHSLFLKFGFFLDDFEYIQALTHSPLLDVFSPFQKFFYRPVFLAWLWTFFHIFGANPLPLHAANLVLFAIVIYLLGVLVYRLSSSLKLAVLSALLFFFWPGKEQAVWWISCASTLLASIFFLTTLLSWHRYRALGGKGYYFAALISLLLSLGSKEDAHALPLVLLAFELYLLSTLPRFAGTRVAGHLKRHWVAYIPFVLAVALYLTCDIIALKNSPFVQAYVTLPRNRALTAMWFTLRIWPFSFVLLPVVTGTAWVLVMLAAMVAACRKSKSAALLLFWTLCICFLIGAEASQENLGSERFLFLPALPASILLAAGLRSLWRLQERGTLLWAALTTATITTFAPWTLPPMGMQAFLMVILMLVLLGAVAWRTRRVTPEIVMVALVVLLILLERGPARTGLDYLYQAAGMTLAAVIVGYRRPALWWQGALAFLLLWHATLYSVTLFLVLSATQPELAAYAKSVKTRWRARTSRPTAVLSS